MKKHLLILTVSSAIMAFVSCRPPAPEPSSSETSAPEATTPPQEPENNTMVTNTKPRVLPPAPQVEKPQMPSLDLATLEGQVVVLLVSTPWANGLKNEMALLEKLHEKIQPLGGTVATAILPKYRDQSDADRVKEFTASYPLGLADETLVNKLGDFRAVPTKFLLDTKGNVVRQYEGYVDAREEQVKNDIKRLLKNAR